MTIHRHRNTRRPGALGTVLAALAIAAPLAGAIAVHARSAEATARRFHTAGVIVSFEQGRHVVFIAHQEIPGFMRAMTMPFEVLDTALVQGLSVRDAVEFEFDARDDDSMVLVSIRRRP